MTPPGHIHPNTGRSHTNRAAFKWPPLRAFWVRLGARFDSRPASTTPAPNPPGERALEAPARVSAHTRSRTLSSSFPASMFLETHAPRIRRLDSHM